MLNIIAAAALTLNLGLGYDLKDGGDTLEMGYGKYQGISDNWRYHGLINLRGDLTGNFGIGYIHGSSLYDGLSGSPRDFDILYIDYKFEIIK